MTVRRGAAGLAVAMAPAALTCGGCALARAAVLTRATSGAWNRLVGQIEFLSRFVLDVIDQLVGSDPDAVVILSDHGVRMPGDDDSLFRNFMAARTPGHPGLHGEAPTPVSVLPRIINAYFGGDLELQPDDRFVGGTDPWLSVGPKAP